MQLYDKDLLSVQEVRELVAAAKKAQQELAGKPRPLSDRILRSISTAGVRNARRPGQKWRSRRQVFGIVDDKVIKTFLPAAWFSTGQR